MNQEQLIEILGKHDLWLRGEKWGERANLTRANLTDANLTDANLTRANLTDADLTDANLTGANLTGANLTDANLTGADLTGANLTGANLTDANLTGADLTGADLTGAKMWGCVGNRRQIKSLFVSEEYPIVYTSEYMQIGCERHSLADWWGFDGERILKMDGPKALNFWVKWKNHIRAIIDLSPAAPTGAEQKSNKPEAA